MCGATECPLECEEVKYTLTKSSASYPSRGYFNYLKKMPKIRKQYNDTEKLTFDELKSRLVSLNVYYEDLGFTSLIEYEKLKLFDLMSSIGGTFGNFFYITF
jgi:hypothetical protein